LTSGARGCLIREPGAPGTGTTRGAGPERRGGEEGSAMRAWILTATLAAAAIPFFLPKSAYA
jgi:hypothetical protein